jgi:hypothetical protein
VWEISEGDIKFLHAMKLGPLEELPMVTIVDLSKCWPILMLILVCSTLANVTLTTPHSPTNMGRNNFLEPTLILVMTTDVDHINIQPTPKLWFQVGVGHTDCFPRKLMWVNTFLYTTFDTR